MKTEEEKVVNVIYVCPGCGSQSGTWVNGGTNYIVTKVCTSTPEEKPKEVEK